MSARRKRRAEFAARLIIAVVPVAVLSFLAIMYVLGDPS